MTYPHDPSRDLRGPTAAQLRVQAQVSVHLARLARWDTAVRLMRLTLARLRRERRVG